MRPKHVPPFVPVLLAAVLLAGMAAERVSAVTQAGTSPSDAHPIVGSWSLLLAAGPPGQAPSLATFAVDGTLLVTDVALGTGHGAWTAGGERSASFVFVFVRERRNGGFAGTTTFRGTAEVAAAGATWSRSTLEGEEAGPFGGARGEIRFPDDPLQLQAERITAAPAVNTPSPRTDERGEALATPVADPTDATPVAAGSGAGIGEVVILLAARPDRGTAQALPVEPASAVVTRRLAALGHDDAVVRVDDRDLLEVRVSGVDGVAAANLLASALSRTGLLEIIDTQGQRLDLGQEVETTLGPPPLGSFPTYGPVYETIVDGFDVVDAFVTPDQTGGDTAVRFRLAAAAAADLADFTAETMGQPLAILLDKRVLSSPTIQDVVANEGTIAGLDRSAAEAVAAQLVSGPLPVPLRVVETSLGPTPAGTPTP